MSTNITILSGPMLTILQPVQQVLVRERDTVLVTPGVLIPGPPGPAGASGSGSVVGGDHASLSALSLQYANSGHVGFAGLNVANVFTQTQTIEASGSVALRATGSVKVDFSSGRATFTSHGEFVPNGNYGFAFGDAGRLQSGHYGDQNDNGWVLSQDNEAIFRFNGTQTGNVIGQYNRALIPPDANPGSVMNGAIIGQIITTQNRSAVPVGGFFAGQQIQLAFYGATGAHGDVYIQYMSLDGLAAPATISNAYGIYMPAIKNAQITNAYAIYQGGASDINYLNGRLGLGITAPTDPLHVVGTSRFVGDVRASGSVLVTVNITTPALTIPTGAFAGYVWTSNSLGVGSWQPGGGSGSVPAHNGLTGLQGGTTNEYYHLTSAQYSALHVPVTLGTPSSGLSITGSQVLTLASASVSQTGALSKEDWFTFNAKQVALGYTPVNLVVYQAFSQSVAAHINDTTIHFTVGSILHSAIQEIGTNTHPQIDTHIANGLIHYPSGSIPHNDLAGKQGGAAGEYYHLTSVQLSALHAAVTIGVANGLSLAGQVLSLASASVTATGALSKEDWFTFSQKQNALSFPLVKAQLPTTIAYKDEANVFTLHQVVSASVVATKRITSGVVYISDQAVFQIDAALGNTFIVQSGSVVGRTIGAPSGSVDGQKITIRVKNTSGGSITHTPATGSVGSYRFGSDITALSAIASGKTDYIGAIYNATDQRWDIIGYIKNY